MIEIYENNESGYRTLLSFEGWRVAILRHNERFSKLIELERHTKTDEVFVLLEGNATLYAAKEFGAPDEFIMEQGKLYNVPKNIWHHIVVSPDANVLIVENSDTSPQNTDIKQL